MTRDPEVVLGGPAKSEPMVSLRLLTVCVALIVSCTCKFEVDVFVMSNEVIVALEADALSMLADELTKMLPVLRLLLCTVPRILTPEIFTFVEVMLVVSTFVDVKEVVTVFRELRREETWIVPDEAKDTFAVAKTDVPETRRELDVICVVTR